MNHRYYQVKILLVVVALIAAGISMLSPAPNYQQSMAYRHYGAAMRVEVAMLRTGQKITHAFFKTLHCMTS